MEKDKISTSEENYKLNLEERKTLVEAGKESLQQFDKTILTLAAAALGLSISFIDKIAPKPIPGTICYLIISWGCFCLSILLTLISFLTSYYACQKQIEILFEQNNKQGKNIYSNVTMWLNYISIAFFMLGVIFLIIFSILNILTKGV